MLEKKLSEMEEELKVNYSQTYFSVLEITGYPKTTAKNFLI